MGTDKEERVLLYPTDKVEGSWFNPNEMAPEEEEQLERDMRANDPRGIDPLHTARKASLVEKGVEVAADLLVCVDGNHRLRIAKRLKWPEVRVIVDEGIKDEASARVVSNNKNAERGRINPLLQAQNFAWLQERGWTQAEIAKAHNMDRTTVAKRLSLIKVVPVAREKVEKVTRGTSPSHLEPIATLETPELQERAAQRIQEQAKYRVAEEGPKVTVKEVEQVVKQVKREDLQERAFRGAVERAKFPTCPKCEGEAARPAFEGLPWVACEKDHSWSLRSGKLYEEVEEEKGEGVAPKGKREREEFPHYLRTDHTLEDFRGMLNSYVVKGLLPEVMEIEKLEVRGTMSDGKSKIDLNFEPTRDRIHFFLDGETISVEKKSYEQEDLKQFKTVITAWPEIGSMKRARAVEEKVSGLFDKYGERIKTTKRVKRRKHRKRGRPKGRKGRKK